MVLLERVYAVSIHRIPLKSLGPASGVCSWHTVEIGYFLLACYEHTKKSALRAIELFHKCIGSDDIRAKTGAIGGNTMTEKHSVAADSGENSDEKPAESRSPRSIRFSDFEWACIEQEAAERGMTAAELVRHAAVGFATSKLTASSSAFRPGLQPRSSASIARLPSFDAQTR